MNLPVPTRGNDVDTAELRREAVGALKKRVAASPKQKLDYPAETEGSRLAREIRVRANKLTKAEREELFKRAMQVYYGGSWPKEAARR